MYRDYRVGGMAFRIEKDSDFRDTDETLPFVSSPCEKTILCTFRASESLNIPGNAPDYENDFLRIYGDLRVFSLPTMARPAALVRETDGNFECEYLKEFSSYFSMAKNLMNAVGLERILNRNDAYVLHCSFLEQNGKAFLFSGPSGVGKSTRADMWIKAGGGRLINGDRAVISEKNGVWYASGLPMCGSSKICLNETLPLKSIVFLKKSSVNKTEKAGTVFAYKKLTENLLLNVWSEPFMKKADDFVLRLCGSKLLYVSECDLTGTSVSEQTGVILSDEQ